MDKCSMPNVYVCLCVYSTFPCPVLTAVSWGREKIYSILSCRITSIYIGILQTDYTLTYSILFS